MTSTAHRQKDPARVAANAEGPAAVYVLDAGYRRFKVGFSGNPAKRCKALSSQHKIPLQLIHERWFDDRKSAYFVEQAVLVRLASDRWGGEWFDDISIDDVWHALDHAALDLEEGRVSVTRGWGTRLEYGLVSTGRICGSRNHWPGPPNHLTKNDLLVMYALAIDDRGGSRPLDHIDIPRWSGLTEDEANESLGNLVAAGYVIEVERPDLPDIIDMMGAAVFR